MLIKTPDSFRDSIIKTTESLYQLAKYHKAQSQANVINIKDLKRHLGL